MDDEDAIVLEDSPDSSRAYEGDISVSESYGSVALSEALGNETGSVIGSRRTDLAGINISGSTILPSTHRQELSSVRQQVELIRARGRIVQLESELDGVRRGTKRARIAEDTSHVTMEKEDEKRLHELEQDRCRLLDDLMTTRSKLEDTKKDLEERTDGLSKVLKTSDIEKKQLHGQIAELRIQLDSSELSVECLKSELTDLRLKQSSQEISELDTLRETHQTSLDLMQSRLLDMCEVQGRLRASEERVRELERQARTSRQDGYFVETVREKLMRYDELEMNCKQLSEENAVLNQSRNNEHLLRYKVQALQDKCERLEALEGEVAKLTLENSDLRKAMTEEGETGVTISGSGLAVLQYRIAQLQSNERVLVRRRGELETKQRLAEKEAALAKESLEQVGKQLARELEGSKVKDDRIQRLEKRLLFVAKEREGCVNVLNSYKHDSGVDALLKENLTELEKQVERREKRITELEAELEQCRSKVKTTIIVN